MARIYIDTAALHELSGQLDGDARELGGLNLDLVRAWSHALPPPAELLVIGAESGRVQARLGVQAGEVAVDAVRLDLYASGVELEERSHRLWGDLAAWSSQIVSTGESVWKRFRAWGSHVLPIVAVDVLETLIGPLGLLPPFRGTVHEVSKIVVATELGISSLAWTTLLTEPGGLAQTQPPPRTVDSPKDLLEIADTLVGDQIAIVKLDDDHYVVLIRGVVSDQPSLYRTDAMAVTEEVHDWGPYSDAVMRAIEDTVPKGASVSFVGHSLGGIVAVNVADRLSQRGYTEGSILTLGSPTTGEAVSRPNLTAIVNDPYGPPLDPVPKLDADISASRLLGHGLPSNVVVVHEQGGALPHDLSVYEKALDHLPHPPPAALQQYERDMNFVAGQKANVSVYNLGP